MNAYDINKIAFVIFAEKGYDATSMKDIANAAGIQKASLYFHFESKASLYLGIIDEQAEEIEQAVANFFGNLKSDDAETVFKDFYKQTVQFFSKKEKLFFWNRIILMNAAYIDKELEEPVHNTLIKINSLVQSGLESVLYKHFSKQLMHEILAQYNMFIFGFLEQMLLAKDNITDRMDHYWDIFWNGVKINQP